MRPALTIQILTLVLTPLIATSVAVAAPVSPGPGRALRPKEPPPPAQTLPAELSRDESLDTGVAPDPEAATLLPVTVNAPTISATRVVRTQSRIVGLGLISGAIEETAPRTIPWLTLTFQNDNQNETGQSYGLSVADRDIWGLHWDTHRFCCLGDYSEPYWGLGLGAFYETRDQMAALVNIESYHLRARAGFEDLFGLNRQLRAEIVVRAGLLGASAQIGLGWTFAADEFPF